MSRAAPILLGLLLGAGARAQTFQRTVLPGVGPELRCITWSDRSFVYHPDRAGSERTPGAAEFAAIDRAFATWQALADSCSDFHFQAGVLVAMPAVGPGSGEGNVLTFREVDCAAVVPATDPCLADDSCADAHRCWSHAGAVIALTTVSYDARTGVALDADVEFNAAAFLFTTVDAPPCLPSAQSASCVATDLQNTLTHEIGHMVGLDHVASPGSTMAAGALVGELSKRRLDPGTAAGFCDTYPRGRPPPSCDPAARGNGQVQGTGVGCGCQGSPGGGLLALGLLALAAARRGRIEGSRMTGR